METEKLYYEDVYRTEFEGTVLSCRPDKKGYAVLLDRTVFYPEGGGQPCDLGTLNGVPVTFVKEHEGQILHYTEEPLEEGSRVQGRIDRTRRFDLMQQHSGEHMISGMICSRYHCDNIGFHLGADKVTIDFNCMIEDEDMKLLEQEVNRKIWENSKVNIFYPTAEELEALEYRSKKELTGQVRIVEFPGADICACCGTHVTYTGEIGLIKLISWQKYKGGMRIDILCGARALAYTEVIMEENSRISVALSAKPVNTAAAVARLQQENLQMKNRLALLETQQIEGFAKELAGQGAVMFLEKGMSVDSVRRLANEVMESCGGFCGVFSDNGEEGIRYAMGEKEGNLKALTQELNEAFQGRGGGKPGFVQGTLKGGITEVAERIRTAYPGLLVKD